MAAIALAAELPARFRKARLNPSDAQAYLVEVHGVPVALATLAKWRSAGGGPDFEKFGPAVFYPRASLDAWVASRITIHKMKEVGDGR